MSSPNSNKKIIDPSEAKSIPYTAFLGIRKEVINAFTIATFSILSIELCLIHIPAPLDIFFSLGNIYLKACYAIFGATIFYFINIQIPKEHKKIKYAHFVHNRIMALYGKLAIIAEGLKLDKSPLAKISKSTFSEGFKTVDPTAAVLSQNFGSYKNWAELLKFLHTETQTILKEILLLQEVVDSKILEQLIHIENSLNLMAFYPFGNTISTDRWKTLERDLFNICESNLKMYAELEQSYKETLKQKSKLSENKEIT